MRQDRGDNNTEENKRPEVLSVSIAPGVYQNVERKDPLEEILSVEDFLLLLRPETEKGVQAELKHTYKDTRKCDYPILPQFRALVYMKLQKIKKLSVLHRKLSAENCRLAEKLGFVKENGEVKLPCYNNFSSWT